jgi:hypothetical protein
VYIVIYVSGGIVLPECVVLCNSLNEVNVAVRSFLEPPVSLDDDLHVYKMGNDNFVSEDLSPERSEETGNYAWEDLK